MASEIERKRRLEILEILGSTICGACGQAKSPRMSHCRRCYFSLPVAVRRALYRKFGAGYEEAYEASLAHLRGTSSPELLRDGN